MSNLRHRIDKLIPKDVPLNKLTTKELLARLAQVLADDGYQIRTGRQFAEAVADTMRRSGRGDDIDANNLSRLASFWERYFNEVGNAE